MREVDLEPELEGLLRRLVPEVGDQWLGASDDEIEQIERLAGGTLPKFYRWFLARMGHSMGYAAFSSLDLSASKVISCYAEKLFEPDGRFLMIGYQPDEMTPLHLVYDLSRQILDDALVVDMYAGGDEVYPCFETLREMIAWGNFLTYAVEEQPQCCSGTLIGSDGEVLSRLSPVMESLGFTTPIPTGRYCALYEGPHASMATNASLDVGPDIQSFDLGGRDAVGLRRILGVIATETSLELKIDEWEPELE